MRTLRSPVAQADRRCRPESKFGSIPVRRFVIQNGLVQVPRWRRLGRYHDSVVDDFYEKHSELTSFRWEILDPNKGCQKLALKVKRLYKRPSLFDYVPTKFQSKAAIYEKPIKREKTYETRHFQSVDNPRIPKPQIKKAAYSLHVVQVCYQLDN